MVLCGALALLDRGFGKPIEACPREYEEPSPLDSILNALEAI